MGDSNEALNLKPNILLFNSEWWKLLGIIVGSKVSIIEGPLHLIRCIAQHVRFLNVIMFSSRKLDNTQFYGSSIW